MSVSGMTRVHIEGLLALSDSSSQRKVCLHHPFLVVAVDNRVSWHGQRVTLGHILGQGGEGLLGLKTSRNNQTCGHARFRLFKAVFKESLITRVFIHML